MCKLLTWLPVLLIGLVFPSRPATATELRLTSIQWETAPCITATGAGFDDICPPGNDTTASPFTTTTERDLNYPQGTVHVIDSLTSLLSPNWAGILTAMVTVEPDQVALPPRSDFGLRSSLCCGGGIGRMTGDLELRLIYELVEGTPTRGASSEFCVNIQATLTAQATGSAATSIAGLQLFDGNGNFLMGRAASNLPGQGNRQVDWTLTLSPGDSFQLKLIAETATFDANIQSLGCEIMDGLILVTPKETPTLVELLPVVSCAPPGNRLQFDVAIENLTQDRLTRDVWIDAFLPNGAPFAGNPVLGPVTVSLGPSRRIQQRASLPVPSSAPAPFGPLVLRGNIGSFGVEPAESSSEISCFVYRTVLVVTGGLTGDLLRSTIDKSFLSEFELLATMATGGFVAEIDNWQEVLRTTGTFYFVPTATGTSELPLKAMCNGEEIFLTVRFVDVQNGYSTGGVGAVTFGGTRLDTYRQQQRLRFFGYPARDGTPLQVDGLTGARTSQAIGLFNASVNNTNVADSPVFDPPAQTFMNATNAPRWRAINARYTAGATLRHGTSWTQQVLNAASQLHSFPPTYRVSDVSPSGGGDVANPHSTHEAGLDVDIDEPTTTDSGSAWFFQQHTGGVVKATGTGIPLPFTDRGGEVECGELVRNTTTGELRVVPHGETPPASWAVVLVSQLVDNEPLLTAAFQTGFLLDRAAYDRDEVRAQFQALFAVTTNSGATVGRILFNDPALYLTIPGVVHVADHSGHYHFDIEPPLPQ